MYKVYCDFDATVVTSDVWHELFHRFGRPEAFTIWREFNAGNMRAAECIEFACRTVQNADRPSVLELFRKQPLREGFPQFAQFCQTNRLELRIVSDGFSGYIRPILELHGLDHIPYWTNDVELSDAGTLDVSFRHQREGCRHCGACKCALLLTTSADDDTIVYIGDGYSDVCPVQMADVVFARDKLLVYCNEHSIPHHPFQDFHEVQHILANYLAERPKYARRHARHRRKELIAIE